MGVLVFGVAPADAPTIDRRAPSTINRTEAPPTPSTTHSVAWNLVHGETRQRQR